MPPTFSIVVPTTGRLSLERALDSLVRQPVAPDDEVLVCGSGPALESRVAAYGPPFRYLPYPTGGHFGYEERTRAIAAATGTHLLFLDDDDAYLPGSLSAIRGVVAGAPTRPILCRMITPAGQVLYRRRTVDVGNVGTPQFVTPNNPGKLGRWTPRYIGDFDFLTSTLAHYPRRDLIWDDTILCACRAYADRVWDGIAV